MNKIIKTVVAIAGIETIRDKEGTVKKLSDTFLNNLRTYKKDHPDYRVIVLDARAYLNCEKPVSALLEDIRINIGPGKLDELVYSGHSDPDGLYVFSHVRYDVESCERILDKRTNWANLPYSEDAIIRLTGCQAGGQKGVKFTNCIAQDISDITGKVVYAFVSKTSQRLVKGRFFQKPDIGGEVKFTPTVPKPV